MQSNRKRIGNDFAWNVRWPNCSLWSSSSLASLVESEKWVWLEDPAGITPASATFMLIVRKRLTCSNFLSRYFLGTVSFFPEDCCGWNNPPRLKARTYQSGSAVPQELTCGAVELTGKSHAFLQISWPTLHPHSSAGGTSPWRQVAVLLKAEKQKGRGNSEKNHLDTEFSRGMRGKGKEPSGTLLIQPFLSLWSPTSSHSTESWTAQEWEIH